MFSVRNLDAAETIMLLASRAACSVRRRRVHSVPNVVSCAADFGRLKVVSSLDVADIAIGPKIHENRQRRVTTADGNPEFDLSTDLEPESGIRQAKEERPPWTSWTGRLRS